MKRKLLSLLLANSDSTSFTFAFLLRELITLSLFALALSCSVISVKFAFVSICAFNCVISFTVAYVDSFLLVSLINVSTFCVSVFISVTYSVVFTLSSSNSFISSVLGLALRRNCNSLFEILSLR